MNNYPITSEIRGRLYRTIMMMLRILRWSFALPMIGLIILNVMLPLMLVPTIFAPWIMIKLAMEAGFVPSLITVAVHFSLTQRLSRLWMIPITVFMATVTAWLWWGLVFEVEPAREKALRDPSLIVLAVAALASLPLAIWARPSRRR